VKGGGDVLGERLPGGQGSRILTGGKLLVLVGAGGGLILGGFCGWVLVGGMGGVFCGPASKKETKRERTAKPPVGFAETEGNG